MKPYIPPAIQRRLAALEHRSERTAPGAAMPFPVNGIGTPQLPPGLAPPPGGFVFPGSPPPNPTGLDLTPGAGGGDVWIDVDWTAPAFSVSGPVVAWLIEVLADGETLPLVFHPTAAEAPPFRAGGLLADTDYHVTVRSISQLGASSTGLSGDVSTGHDTAPPPALTGLAGAANYTGAVVHWNGIGTVQVPFQGYYRVQTATAADFSSGLISRNVGLATVASFSGFATGVQRWFRVRAVSTGGVSGDWSDPITLTPGTVAPGDLGAGTIAAGVVYAGEIFGEQITAGTINAAVAAIINLNASNITTGSMSAGRLSAGTIGAYLIQLASGGIIRSANYVPGVSGWQVDGAGNAELNSAVFRGIVAAMQLATNGMTVYDSSGEPAIRMQVDMVAGSPKAAIALGAGIGIGAALYWYHDNYTFHLIDPGIGRAGMVIDGASLELERTLWANGSVRVGGIPYAGGVYPQDDSGGTATHWGLEISNPASGTYYSYIKGHLDGTGDRRIGWFDPHALGSWLAYANTNGDLNARTTWFVFSDRKLKKQIKTLGTVTERMRETRPVSFFLRDDKHRSAPRLGLVADDEMERWPELSRPSDDDQPAAFDYTALSVAVLRYAQEIDARLQKLEAQAGK